MTTQEALGPITRAEWESRYAAQVERQAQLVAWMFQHGETGLMTCLANDGVNTPESFLRDNTRHAFISACYAAPHAPARLTDEELRKDAERWRWGVAHAAWYRNSDRAHIAIPVAMDADLSCIAMRVAAIDAAMKP